jgi:hypothetical protein
MRLQFGQLLLDAASQKPIVYTRQGGNNVRETDRDLDDNIFRRDNARLVHALRGGLLRDSVEDIFELVRFSGRLRTW